MKFRKKKHSFFRKKQIYLSSGIKNYYYCWWFFKITSIIVVKNLVNHLTLSFKALELINTQFFSSLKHVSLKYTLCYFLSVFTNLIIFRAILIERFSNTTSSSWRFLRVIFSLKDFHFCLILLLRQLLQVTLPWSWTSVWSISIKI